MKMSRLADRVAIVTGSSSGLGRAIAIAYAENGASVVCADLKAEGHQAAENERPTHEEVNATGGKSIFCATDVGDSENVQALVKAAVREYGRLDIMVNNAGIAPEAGDPMPVYETTEKRFDSTMQVNARGTFLGCKYASAQMLKQEQIAGSDRGWIINLASGLALVGLSGTPAYSASKGAVVSMTRAMAMDFAPFYIHCNAILPGFMRTPMNAMPVGDPTGYERLINVQPFHRLGEPDEVANAAVFLASDEASGITGVALRVDGGITIQLKV